MAYATIADLELRWRELEPGEDAMATQLLNDAATIIDAFLGGSSVVDSDILSIVSCDMVRRAMTGNADSFALGSVNDYAQVATPYEASVGLWLTYNDKKLLGCFKGQAFTIRPDLHCPAEDGGYGAEV